MIEPRATIYVPLWCEATKRLAEQPQTRDTPKIRRLLAQVERGWGYARVLQLLYEQHQEYANRGETPAAELLNFIDGYVVDVFRVLAFSAADLVPGGSRPRPSRFDLGGKIDEFAIFASMLYLSSGSSADLPQDFSSTVRQASEPLVGWVSEYRTLAMSLLPRQPRS